MPPIVSPPLDLQQLRGCTCLSLRRATRRVTRLYDQALEPAGITITQFGLLAHLYALDGIPIGVLADLLGMDPTSLNRTLKGPIAAGLVRDGADPKDRRVRAIFITDAGITKLHEAAGLWRLAQDRIVAALGQPTQLALNGLLDLTTAKLAG